MSMVDASRESAATPALAVAAPAAGAGVVRTGGQPIRRHRSLWGDAWRRLIRNKLAMFGLFGIVFLLFLTVSADLAHAVRLRLPALRQHRRAAER